MQITRNAPVRFGTSLHPLTQKIHTLINILKDNGVDADKLNFKTVGSDKLVLTGKTDVETANLVLKMSEIARKPNSGLNQMQDVGNMFGLDKIGGILIQVGQEKPTCGDGGFCGTKPPGKN